MGVDAVDAQQSELASECVEDSLAMAVGESGAVFAEEIEPELVRTKKTGRSAGEHPGSPHSRYSDRSSLAGLTERTLVPMGES